MDDEDTWGRSISGAGTGSTGPVRSALPGLFTEEQEGWGGC